MNSNLNLYLGLKMKLELSSFHLNCVKQAAQVLHQSVEQLQRWRPPCQLLHLRPHLRGALLHHLHLLEHEAPPARCSSKRSLLPQNLEQLLAQALLQPAERGTPQGLLASENLEVLLPSRGCGVRGRIPLERPDEHARHEVRRLACRAHHQG